MIYTTASAKYGKSQQKHKINCRAALICDSSIRLTYNGTK